MAQKTSHNIVKDDEAQDEEEDDNEEKIVVDLSKMKQGDGA